MGTTTQCKNACGKQKVDTNECWVIKDQLVKLTISERDNKVGEERDTKHQNRGKQLMKLVLGAQR